MRLNLFCRGRDVIDVELHLWRKRTDPAPAAPKDEGPPLRASGSLQSSQIAGRMEPDTTTFGFARRYS